MIFLPREDKFNMEPSANHYVDNKKLYEAIIEYKTQAILAKKQKEDKPRIPEYVGYCIMMIAQRLSLKPNFVNYSFRDEMISDGYENCVSYFDNFDPAKSSNPFAYFTQIIYYAFLRRILKERKQTYIKHKSAEFSMLFDSLADVNDFDDKDKWNFFQVNTENQQAAEFIKSFEDTAKEKKDKKKKLEGIEKFLEE